MRVPTKSPQSKTMPTSLEGQLMKQKKLLEPTIGLEPMTCRLRNDAGAALSYCKQIT